MTKSLYYYLNINGQTSGETQPLENHQNCFVVFDDILLSKQESNFDLFLLQDFIILSTFTKYLKAVFISQKTLSVIILT